MMESSKLVDYIGKKRKVLIDRLLNADERLQLCQHVCPKSNKQEVSNKLSQFTPNQFQGMNKRHSHWHCKYINDNQSQI